MNHIPRRSITHIALTLFVLLLAFNLTGASDRFNTLGHKLMCTCGCNEVLLECNHVGCRTSEKERAELAADIQSGMSDDAIFKAFAAEYGATVLVVPMRGGFDNVAWIMPFAVLGVSILGTLFLIVHWRKRSLSTAAAASTTTAPPPAASQSTAADSIRDRIRKETEL